MQPRVLHLLFLGLLGLLSLGSAQESAHDRIKNVVVIVFENSSFDRIFSCLKEDHPKIDACRPGDTSLECTNPIDPSDPNSKRIPITCDAEYYPPGSPGHSVVRSLNQIYGFRKPHDPPTMDGFVKDFEKEVGPEGSHQIMQAFSSKKLPAFHTLAKEFLLFDQWHCALPGPTQPNRLYINSATSHGLARNNVEKLAWGFPHKSLFQVLDEDSGLDWRTYFQAAPTTLFFQYARNHFDRIKVWDEFLEDAKNGNLPAYSYLEPRYFEFLGAPGNDMHPQNHAANEADKLLAEIYHALRHSPQWNQTALLVTFDEHGGFFSKTPPPLAPNPDGMDSDDPVWDFSRVGPRVPALLISPWVRKGAVATKDRQGRTFEHSSVVKSVREILAGKENAAPLTRREAWAGSFAYLLEELREPRLDTPLQLPKTPEAGVRPMHVPPPGEGRMGSFHQAIVIMCASLNRKNQTAALLRPPNLLTEAEAANFCAQELNTWLGYDAMHVPPLD